MAEGFKRLFIVALVLWWAFLAFTIIGLNESAGTALLVALFYGVLVPSVVLALLRALGWVLRVTGAD